jgi:molybdate transport system ATP-binding protein
LVCDHIKYITVRDSYGDADGNFYYQQRWNSQDMETTPLVSELLPQVPDSEWKNNLYGLFGVEEMLDKQLVLLSSGELRRFQLVKALLSQPRVLILDNPFIGLDTSTRTLLRELLERMIRAISLQVILVLSRVDEIPPFITHVVPVEGLVCGNKIERNAYLCEAKNVQSLKMNASVKFPRFAPLNDLCHEEVVKLNKVTIRYGERTILKDLDWVVHRGEKWALTGDNGSGKSTLLSLVCADNPQSYACDIAMFGRKRGTGESIWEIKKRIGYVSPEIHRAYLKNIPAIDIVASGLHDSVGLYVRPKPEQRSVCEEWLDVFGIGRALGEDMKNWLQASVTRT